MRGDLATLDSCQMDKTIKMARYAERFGIAILILFFSVALIYYPAMPDPMASHWNIEGSVDGFMPKFWGVFVMPFLAIGVFLLFHFIPVIDSLKKNIRKFRSLYDQFFIMMIVFFFYIYTLTLLWNLGMMFNIGRLLMPALGVLFFYVSLLLENSEPNWFIGIRTPWTLSSKRVWNQTHRVGSVLFRVLIGGALLGMFAPTLALYFVVLPVVAVAVFLVIYSYAIYKK